MDQKRNIAWKFVADAKEFLSTLGTVNKSVQDVPAQAIPKYHQLALSADEVKAKMTLLNKEIGGMKDLDAIRAKQAELKALGDQMDVINDKQKEVLAPPPAASASPGSAVGMGAFFGSMAGGLATQAFSMVAGGVGKIKAAMIDGNAEMEQYKASFETMLGSADKADALMGQLKQFGAETPFEFPGLAQNATMLKQFGVETAKILPTLQMLGDVSGGSQEKLNGLALVFAQVKSAGKLQGQDLMQMINQGFNPLDAIAKKAGKSIGQMKEEMSKGKVTFDMVEQAFKDVTAEGGQFHGMMAKQAGTLTGMQSTFNDVLGEMGRDLGKPLFDAAKEGLGKVLETLQKPETQEAIRAIAQRFGDLFSLVVDNKELIGIVAAAWGLYAAKQKLAGFELTKFTSALKANPYAILAAGIAAAVVALKDYQESTMHTVRSALKETDAQIKLTESAKKATQAKIDQGKKNIDLMASFESLGKKINRTKEEEGQYRDALGKLQLKYPDVVSAGNTFEQNLAAIKKMSSEAAIEIGGLQIKLENLDKQQRMQVMERSANAVDAMFETLREKIHENHKTTLAGVLDISTTGYLYKVTRDAENIIKGAFNEEELADAAVRAQGALNKGFAAEGLHPKSNMLAEYFATIDKAVAKQKEYIDATNMGGRIAEANTAAELELLKQRAIESEKDRKAREKRNQEEMERSLRTLGWQQELEALLLEQNKGSEQQKLDLKRKYKDLEYVLVESYMGKISSLDDRLMQLRHDKVMLSMRTFQVATTKMDEDLILAFKRLRGQYDETAYLLEQRPLKIIPEVKTTQLQVDATTSAMDKITAFGGQAADVMSNTMGNMASSFRQGSAAYKIAATGQATIATLTAAIEAYKAGASVPLVGMVLGPLAAAAATAAGFANVRAIQSVKMAEGGILRKTVFVAGEAGEEAVTPLRQMPYMIADSLEHVLKTRFETHPFYAKEDTFRADIRSHASFSHFDRAQQSAQFQRGRNFV